MQRHLGRIGAIVLGILIAPLAFTLMAQQSEQVAPKSRTSKLYIVQMAQPPVVVYRGGVDNLAATAIRGQKVDPTSPAVIGYVGYLRARHDEAIARTGGRKVHDYTYTYNGFSAELTEAQAEAMKTVAGVISVTKDEIRKPDTSSTPAFLGLSASGGAWDALGGVKNAGEGIVVGIVDSGIWPENPGFSDRTGASPTAKTGKLDYQQIPGWHGKCTPGEQFPASACNQKLIGAQWFSGGFGGDASVKQLFPYEYASARDADGHGTHTSSTAAGNNGVIATVAGTNLGAVSGMAPRARISTYKVCWGRTEGGCASSDSVAAIDQAVADGVDVINFSISGSRTSFVDPVEIAFLYAAEAGVFVAASAGNSGPGASTVAHNSPWLTTVAAGTHDRLYNATVTLGNGAVYTGAGLGAAVPSTPVVLSTAAGLASAAAEEVRLCYIGRLDPAKVTGRIVVCDRGVNARTDKSAAVKMAGGIGMILVNTGANSLNADLHSVPSVHLSHLDRPAVVAYAANAGATAALGQGQQIAGAQAPSVASFSSRGPALAGAGDLVKPDIMAPGVDILAAVSPAGYNGRNWDYLSGTSMSSPHMAGLGALMKQAHPGWTPMMIKSAFMTTASQVRNDGTGIPGGPFAIGAGHVVPNSALDPGLVYDAGWNDWLAFLCGTRNITGATCTTLQGMGYSLDPSDLNYPSIGIGALAGAQTVKRSVTNVGGSAATYASSVTAPSGITVVVSPASLTLLPGETKGYTVTFTSTPTAGFNSYAIGSLTWSDGTHTVRSPIAVRPVALAAPAEVSGSYSVTFGYTGAFSATPRGLVAAAVTPGTVTQDPAQTFAPGGAGVVAVPVTVPAGLTYARFSLFDADVAPGADIDMYVYRDGNLVGSSGSGTSAEEVSLVNPAAGSYTVFIHGWGLPAGSSPFRLHAWLLGSASAGNMSVSAPASAVTGATGSINLTFTGLTPAKYLGSIVYGGTASLPSPTIVRVDVP